MSEMLIEHIRRCNEISRKERPGWYWNPPRPRKPRRKSKAATPPKVPSG